MAHDVKVVGYESHTGKFYRAVRGEVGSKVWAWLEIPDSEVAKAPEHEAGDMIVPLRCCPYSSH